MFTAPRPVTYAAAIMTLVSSLALATSASADTMPAAQSKPLATTHASMPMGQHVEARIKTLHDKLNITSDQEEAWANVASAMRDNETAFKAMIDEREKGSANMTAVDDLASYQKLMQAHADNAQKVLDAFQPLYESMSDAQKKNADAVFGDFEGKMGSKKMIHKVKHTMAAPAAPATTAPQGE